MPVLTTNYSLNKPNVNSADDEDLWGAQLNANFDTIDTQMKTNADAIAAFVAVPPGTVLDYAGASAPSGYLFCFGQEVSRTTYATLFAAIGTTFGAGDGSTTFLLPDLRGRVAAGKDDMGGSSANRLTDQPGGLNGDTLGDTGGAETHQLSQAELPNANATPTNTGDDGNVWHDFGFSSGVTTSGVVAARSAVAGANAIDTTKMPNYGLGGSDTPHNNVQPCIILNKIIKT